MSTEAAIDLFRAVLNEMLAESPHWHARTLDEVKTRFTARVRRLTPRSHRPHTLAHSHAPAATRGPVA